MNISKKLFVSFFVIITIFSFFILPDIIIASNGGNGVVILAPSAIGQEEKTVSNFFTYAEGIYNTMLIVAVIAAALMITIGGVYYIFSYVPGMKEEGKKTITAAVLGLLIALMSWLILYTINPDLLKFSDRIFMQDSSESHTP